MDSAVSTFRAGGYSGQPGGRMLRVAEARATRGAPADLSCVLTFDVEDWFQVENLRPMFPRAGWHRIPRRVGDAVTIVLDFLGAHGLRATFFTLGWVAEREPGLVRRIAGEGHEVACHGYGHVLPTQLTVSEFRDDVSRAKRILEDLTGQPVVGYRAPSFSLDHDHLAILGECGFHYDSSVHPFSLHGRYARLDGLGVPLRPGVYRLHGRLAELALPVERFGPIQVPIAGGGYFRLYPGAVFRRLVRRALIRDGHYVMYLHSWEFDAAQPRVRARNPLHRKRHYHNLARTLPRMQELVRMLAEMNVRFVTAHDFLKGVAGALSVPAAVPEESRWDPTSSGSRMRAGSALVSR